MEEQKTKTENTAASIRLLGILILIGGIILLAKALLAEITVEPDYANLSPESLQNLPDKVVNLELISNKINSTVLGGFLIVIGIQLCLVSSKLISEINQQFKKPI